MRYKIFITPETTENVDNIYNWYEDQQLGLGELFLEELAEYYEKIEQNPEICSWVNKRYRHAILHRFPYVIIYEVNNLDVYIDAVLHTSRNHAKSLKTGKYSEERRNDYLSGKSNPVHKSIKSKM